MITQLKILKNQAPLHNLKVLKNIHGYFGIERDGVQFIFEKKLNSLLSHVKFYVFINGKYFSEDYIHITNYTRFYKNLEKLINKYKKLWILQNV